MPHWQTTEDRATQLLYSIQFKLSHAISWCKTLTAQYFAGVKKIQIASLHQCSVADDDDCDDDDDDDNDNDGDDE